MWLISSYLSSPIHISRKNYLVHILFCQFSADSANKILIEIASTSVKWTCYCMCHVTNCWFDTPDFLRNFPVKNEDTEDNFNAKKISLQKVHWKFFPKKSRSLVTCIFRTVLNDIWEYINVFPFDHRYSDFGDECLLPKQGSFLKLIEIKEAYNQNFWGAFVYDHPVVASLVSVSGANYCQVLPLKINNSYSTDETIYSDLDICIYYWLWLFSATTSTA